MTKLDQTRHQLSFCKICLNSSPSLKNGISCNLTNEKPKFKKSCKEYSVDTNAILRAKEKIQREIEIKYSNGNFINFLKSQSYFSEEEILSNDFSDFPKNKTIYNISKITKWGPLLFSTIALLYLSKLSLINKVNNNVILIAYLIFISILTYSLILIFFSKPKTIIIDDLFLQTNNLKLFWNEILDVSIYTKNNDEGFDSYICLIGTNSGLVREIDMTGFNPPMKIAAHIATRKNILQHGL